MLPSLAASRAGSPRLVSQAGAAADLMIAAVLAVLASVQLAAATVAVSQQLLTGRPVAGDRMWWSRTSPRRHRRSPVPDVASPPSRIATTGPGRRNPSTTLTRQPLG